MKFGLIMRAYAPFYWFGGIFRGDSRAPTTSADVTSRVKAWVEFDPIAGRVSSPHAKSDESHFIAVIPYTATAAPMTRIDGVKIGKNTLYFRLHAAGANPLFPKSPNIDMRVAITASVAPDRLYIQAELAGDQFPNCEVILQDEKGGRRMLMHYATDGSAHAGPFGLIGKNSRPMNAICMSYPISNAGHFQ